YVQPGVERRSRSTQLSGRLRFRIQRGDRRDVSSSRDIGDIDIRERGGDRGQIAFETCLLDEVESHHSVGAQMTAKSFEKLHCLEMIRDSPVVGLRTGLKKGVHIDRVVAS